MGHHFWPYWNLEFFFT